jgi:hypothetical protein
MIIADDRIGLLDRGKSSDRSMKKITGKVRVENENNNTLKTKGYNKRAEFRTWQETVIVLALFFKYSGFFLSYLT